jgi:hypothetical protein
VLLGHERPWSAVLPISGSGGGAVFGPLQLLVPGQRRIVLSRHGCDRPCYVDRYVGARLAWAEADGQDQRVRAFSLRGRRTLTWLLRGPFPDEGGFAAVKVGHTATRVVYARLVSEQRDPFTGRFGATYRVFAIPW